MRERRRSSDRAALRSEKLGLRVLQAQAHYQLGRALELSGDATAGKAEYAEARRAAADVLKEAQTDAVTKRSDWLRFSR